MSTTVHTQQLLSDINDSANEILDNGGGEEDLLYSLPDVMDKIKNVMDSSTKSELDNYCQKYSGFYRYVLLLQHLAEDIADGTISVST